MTVACYKAYSLVVTPSCGLTNFNALNWGVPVITTAFGASGSFTPNSLPSATALVHMAVLNIALSSVTVDNTALLVWPGHPCNCNLRIVMVKTNPFVGGLNVTIDGGSGGGGIFGVNGFADPSGTYDFPFTVDNAGVGYTIQVDIKASATRIGLAAVSDFTVTLTIVP